MSERISSFTVEGAPLQLFVSDCANCGIVFGIPDDLERRRRDDGKPFFCPNGHNLVFSDRETHIEKRKAAEARELAMRDQLAAAIRDREASNQQLIKERSRFAAGLCPCCTRTFANVQRHMESKHPDYDVNRVKAATTSGVRFKCSCGMTFESFRGLRTHQGWQRDSDGGWAWDAPSAPEWARHLTVV